MIDTRDIVLFSYFYYYLMKIGQIMLIEFAWHHRSQCTHQFAWWSFQYWLLIITVLHPRLWLRDSTTKAARRKCQRILGKQSKAFELMRHGAEGEILVQISPLLFSHWTEYIFSPQSVSYLPFSLIFFFFPSSPSLTVEMKQINPYPMSRKLEQ